MPRTDAPVIAYQQMQITDSWQEQTMVVGQALGRAEQARRVVAAVETVRSGHYLPVSVDAISALRLPSVLSIPYGLDQLEPGLAKALD